MDNQFEFSIVIAIYNTEKYLSEAIDSIINQTFDFNKVQLILVDDGSRDNCGEICKKYQKQYPNNIKYIRKENEGQSIARNLGMKFATGKYVNFLDSDDKFESNALEEVYSFYEKYGNEIDVVSTPRYYFGAKDGPLSLNYRFSETRVIDIYEEFDCPQLSISCTFIRRDAITSEFNPRLIISEDAVLVNEIILKKCRYGVVNTTKYLYRKREDETSTINTKKLDKTYFTARLYHYDKHLINYSIEKFGYVLKYVQFALMFDLQWMYEENTIRDVLDDVEFLQFESLLYKVLQNIDDDIILAQRYLDKYLKHHILKFKHDPAKFILVPSEDDLVLKYGNTTIDRLSTNKVTIIDFNKTEDMIHIKGLFDSCFEDVKILAFNDDIKLNVSPVEGRQRFALGNQISNIYYFEINEPLSSISEIRIVIEINSKTYLPKLSKNPKADLKIENNILQV